MNTLKDRLKAAMKGPPKVNQVELAAACGVKPPSVSNWLTGETKSLRGKNLTRAAAFLKVNVSWLAEGRGPMRPKDGQSMAPLYEDQLSQRGFRIISRLADAEAAQAASENVYRIIEHALALGMDKPMQDFEAEVSPEEKQNIVSLYEQLPAHRREALLVFIKSWMAE